MRDFAIRVNDRHIPLARRVVFARKIAWLAWMQLIGKNAQLNFWDCETLIQDKPKGAP